MVASAPSVSIKRRPDPPHFAFNDEPVSSNDPIFLGGSSAGNGRATTPNRWHQPECPLSSRESPSLIPSSEHVFESPGFAGSMMDVGEGSFEEPELPQDPALILPDQLEFYAHIKVGFIEIYAFNLSSNIDY